MSRESRIGCLRARCQVLENEWWEAYYGPRNWFGGSDCPKILREQSAVLAELRNLEEKANKRGDEDTERKVFPSFPDLFAPKAPSTTSVWRNKEGDEIKEYCDPQNGTKFGGGTQWVTNPDFIEERRDLLMERGYSFKGSYRPGRGEHPPEGEIFK